MVITTLTQQWHVIVFGRVKIIISEFISIFMYVCAAMAAQRSRVCGQLFVWIRIFWFIYTRRSVITLKFQGD